MLALSLGLLFDQLVCVLSSGCRLHSSEVRLKHQLHLSHIVVPPII